LEEIKGTVRDLPAKVADAVVEVGDPMRRRRLRRLHPRMIEDIMHMGSEFDDPIALLMMASLVRDEIPWFYEIAMEAYHAVKGGDPAAAKKEIERLHRIRKFALHGPMSEEFGFGGEEAHMFFMEFPHMLERMLSRSIEVNKPRHRERLGKTSAE
jgi:hypothetical protein